MSMRSLTAVASLVIAGTGLNAFGQNAAQVPNPDAYYRLGPDSLEQDGVPKGEIRGPFTLPTTVFPGTQHTYWVYVPAHINYAWGMNRHGQAMGGAILPEMMRWLWRDQPVSTDPRDMVERSYRVPPVKN